jgi:8-oxo-dGTP pyrophosphatase MutT (NUDIX family)
MKVSGNMTHILGKVTAFVIRQNHSQRELLVFAHPTAGIQVPAGTVEDGETFEDSVLREIHEETGLEQEQVRLVKTLAESSYSLKERRCAFLQATPLFSEPSLTSAPVDIGYGDGSSFRRGMVVLLHREVEGWSEIIHEEYDLNVSPPKTQFSVRGWVPSHYLSAQQVRRFFLLTPTRETPGMWEHLAEERYLFRLHWMPLVPRPQLIPPQDEWLNMVYDQLVI